MSEEVSLEKINPAALKEAEWLQKRDDLVVKMTAIKAVDSDEVLEVTGKLQKQASKLIKGLSNSRLELTRPLDTMKTSIMDQERELIADISTALIHIKRLNSEYATKVAAEAEAERERLAKIERDKASQIEADKQKEKERLQGLFGSNAVIDTYEPPAEELPVPTVAPSGKVRTSSTRTVTVWDFTIVDSAQVPREFCTVDEKKIRAYKNSQVALEKDPVISGVKFTKSIDIRSR